MSEFPKTGTTRGGYRYGIDVRVWLTVEEVLRQIMHRELLRDPRYPYLKRQSEGK